MLSILLQIGSLTFSLCLSRLSWWVISLSFTLLKNSIQSDTDCKFCFDLFCLGQRNRDEQSLNTFLLSWSFDTSEITDSESCPREMLFTSFLLSVDRLVFVVVCLCFVYVSRQKLSGLITVPRLRRLNKTCCHRKTTTESFVSHFFVACLWILLRFRWNNFTFTSVTIKSENNFCNRQARVSNSNSRKSWDH
jgi:hypothetical protein